MFALSCLRRTIHIKWFDKITNEICIGKNMPYHNWARNLKKKMEQMWPGKKKKKNNECSTCYRFHIKENNTNNSIHTLLAFFPSHILQTCLKNRDFWMFHFLKQISFNWKKSKIDRSTFWHWCSVKRFDKFQFWETPFTTCFWDTWRQERTESQYHVWKWINQIISDKLSNLLLISDLSLSHASNSSCLIWVGKEVPSQHSDHRAFFSFFRSLGWVIIMSSSIHTFAIKTKLSISKP